MACQIETLVKFGQSLLAGANIDSVLPEILELVIQDTGAERGRIELCGIDGEPSFRAVREHGQHADTTTLIKPATRFRCMRRRN